VSWLLAFAGFAALVILHELGHFTAAKAVGMRVERFSLFFPPLLARVRRGETEYAVGAIPLGGYVKITGMNPAEELPPEVAPRAYFRQPVWKRIVVIAAGPAVNIVLAFAILSALYLANGTLEAPSRIDSVQARTPAAGHLRPGDVIVGVDGPLPHGDLNTVNKAIVDRIGAHHGTPVTFMVRRSGQLRAVTMRPFLDRTVSPQRYRLGVALGGTPVGAGPGRATTLALGEMWSVTEGTVKAIAGVFDTQQRKKLSGVVGSYEVTRQAAEVSLTDLMVLLALISLSLGVVNLFPFLPLDGGHIFWAVAEKVRGRAIPFSVMERAGFVGFALVIGLFVIGLSNDIGRLTGGGFQVR
jgi:regulator of sigma E protease